MLSSYVAPMELTRPLWLNEPPKVLSISPLGLRRRIHPYPRTAVRPPAAGNTGTEGIHIDRQNTRETPVENPLSIWDAVATRLPPSAAAVAAEHSNKIVTLFPK